MEDPSGDDFSHITDQITGLLNEMLPSTQTNVSTNGLLNFRMLYNNSVGRTPPVRINPNEHVQNLLSLIQNRSHHTPRMPMLSRRLSLASLFRQPSIGDILRHSMENTGGIKQVGSDELLESISKLPEIKDISADEECSICMDGYSDSPGIRVDCNHIFHRECITEWFKGDHRCPVCRHEYPSKEISLVTVPNQSETTEEDTAEESNNPGEVSDDDTDEENIQPVNVSDNPVLNITMRSLGNILRDTFSDPFEDELREERLIQQAIFDSLREPIPIDRPTTQHDISGSNNESD